MNLVLRILKRSAGMTYPGYLALKLYPLLFEDPRLTFRYGYVLISGTNGKTTTSKMIAHLLEKEGYSVLSNRSGANVLNGLASSLLLDRDLFGRTESDIAVLEVDEFFLPYMMRHVYPKIVVLLNLSRDQLDRYGEVDIVYERWTDAIEDLDSDVTSLVVDSTQDIFSDIMEHFSGDVTFFDEDKRYLEVTGLSGDFNAKNINAALGTVTLLGLPKEKAVNYLNDFGAAFGRGEDIFFNDSSVRVLLAKNPASFNQNLNTVIDYLEEYRDLVFVLNDNIPDGRDVSWIYDIDRTLLRTACVNRNIYVTGKRYLDMAIRLNYADVTLKDENISSNLSYILKKSSSSDDKKKLLILPNYSAMLQVRKIITGRHIL